MFKMHLKCFKTFFYFVGGISRPLHSLLLLQVNLFLKSAPAHVSAIRVRSPMCQL